jgi:hypothetical protein
VQGMWIHQCHGVASSADRESDDPFFRQAERV